MLGSFGNFYIDNKSNLIFSSLLLFLSTFSDAKHVFEDEIPKHERLNTLCAKEEGWSRVGNNGRARGTLYLKEKVMSLFGIYIKGMNFLS